MLICSGAGVAPTSEDNGGRGQGVEELPKGGGEDEAAADAGAVGPPWKGSGSTSGVKAAETTREGQAAAPAAGSRRVTTQVRSSSSSAEWHVLVALDPEVSDGQRMPLALRSRSRCTSGLKVRNGLTPWSAVRPGSPRELRRRCAGTPGYDAGPTAAAAAADDDVYEGEQGAESESGDGRVFPCIGPP